MNNKVMKVMTTTIMSLAAVVTASISISTDVKAETLSAKEIKEYIDDIDGVNLDPDDLDFFRAPWINADILGWQITPSAKLKKQFSNVKTSVNDDDFIRYYTEDCGLTEEAFKNRLYEISSVSWGDDSFTVYGSYDDMSMYVITPEKKYVEIHCSPVSVHEQWPDFEIRDLDKDGERELIIIPHILHGTGYWEDTYIVVDKDADGDYFAYHLPAYVYDDYLADHLKAVNKNKKLSLLLDGKEVGEKCEVPSADFTYVYNSRIQITTDSECILVASTPYATNEDVGGIGDFSKYKIWLTVNYEGEGRFEVSDAISQLDALQYYEETISELNKGAYYGFLEGPAVDIPALLLSNEVIESYTTDVEQNFGHAPCFCDILILENGKRKIIGTMDGDSSVYVTSSDINGLYVKEYHCIKQYNIIDGELVLTEGVKDGVTDEFDNKDGYRRYNGFKTTPITKKEYQEYRDTHGLHEIVFERNIF